MTTFLGRNNWLAFNGLQRCFSTLNQILMKSHYDALGISAKATQTDIKTAYYKLSKLYHPDKNKGSSDAAVKFHEITAAYEVLGNYKLRRLYDKGIIHSAEDKPRDQTSHVYEDLQDDPQTKFYKQHMRKSEKPTASGRTPIYDFDEWSRMHYAESFTRNQNARDKYNRKNHDEHNSRLELQKHNFVFVLTIFLIVFMLIYLQEVKHDRPKEVQPKLVSQKVD